MKYLVGLAGLCLMVFICGCAMTVTYDYDKYTDFSKLKTYDWLPIPVRGSVGEAKIQELKNIVDEDLAAKGLGVSPDAPDFLVSAHMGKSERVKRKDVKTTGGAASRIKEIPEEKYLLRLEFIDPESKRILWEGVAKVKFDEKPALEKRDARINEAVKEMMQKYPPPAS